MTTTLITALPPSFGDNTLPVFCNDTSDICTIGTDFIFDALNPACYAAGAVPSTNSSVPIGGLVNLARNVTPALSRTSAGAVTAIPVNSGDLPVFDGKGWQFNSSQLGMQIEKGGIVNNRVCEPTLEGFINFLEIVWFRWTTWSANSSPFFHGQEGSTNPTGGFEKSGSSGVFDAEPNSVPAIPATGSIASSALTQLAVAYTFNVGGNTTSVQAYLNGVANGGAASGLAPASYSSSNINAGAFIGQANSSTPFVGSVYRVVREFFGVSGVSPAAFVAADYAYGVPRFT